ncbi:MAG: hypothetical protein Q9195_006433 [Heterodermia aff. obscurata]
MAISQRQIWIHPSRTSPASMPRYSLSNIFKRISFVAFCRLHQIKSVGMDDLEQSLLRLFRYLRHNKFENDLGISDGDLEVRWPRFEDAVDDCRKQGFSIANLSELINVVVELGGSRVAWSSTFDMDRSGRLRVTQAL